MYVTMSEKQTDGIKITRRDMIISGALASIAGALGLTPQRVSGASTGINSINDLRAQYDSGVTNFAIDIDNDPLLVYDENLTIPDRNIFAQVDLAINRQILTESLPSKIGSYSGGSSDRFESDKNGLAGVESGFDGESGADNKDIIKGDFETIGEAQVLTSEAERKGGVVFGSSNVDSGTDNYLEVPLETPGGSEWGSQFPLDTHSAIESGYTNIGVVDKSIIEGEPIEGVPRNRNTFELRFRIGSTNGSINEEDIIEFETDITIELGPYSGFGVNFGESAINEWSGESYEVGDGTTHTA